MILLKSIPEISGLRKSLVGGKINGSTYEGECCCLVGTIANVKGCNYNKLPGITPDSGRPAERWFMGIKPGMTADNSVMVKLTIDWIDEFISYVQTQK